MKNNHFAISIKDVLQEINLSEKDKEKVKNDFIYTYLIFDFDAQHCEKKEKHLPINQVVALNCKRLEEMVQYFVDETDDTVGKLYINYPMMESYKDCKCFFDVDYANKIVKLQDISKYKETVHHRSGIASIHLNKYTKKDFEKLTLMNLYKLNVICKNSWAKPTYEQYRMYSEQCNILDKEQESIMNYEQISVLNSSLFFVTDYYGNKNKYYDNLTVD